MTEFSRSENWQPTATVAHLRRRSALLARVRQAFLARDFIEVQTPILSHETIIDRYIEPVAVDLAGERFYLHTSPEFAMKRLLAAGMTKIWQLVSVFRGGENGARHNTEFTMLEWYETGISYEQGRRFLADLIDEWTGGPACVEFSYEDVLEQATGLDFDASLTDFRDWARRQKLDCPESCFATDRSFDWSDWLDLIFDAVVLPALPRETPVILYDFPESGSQLARIHEVDRGGRMRRVAARFELYFRGMELANGYDELRDANELRLRFAERQRERARDGHAELPPGLRLLAAMRSGFPPTCGCALGFDRLMMALENTDQIDSILAFPTDRA